MDVQPNDRSRTVKETSGATDQELERREFWTRVNERLARSGKVPQPKPETTPTAHFRSQRNNRFQLRASFSTRNQHLQVALVIRGSNSFAFAKIPQRQKSRIERTVGASPKWNIKDSGKESVISIERPNTDPEDQDEWITNHLELFRDAFWERSRSLNAADYRPSETGADVTDAS